MATGGLTTTPSLDWFWIASKAIFTGSPAFGSIPSLSLARLLALDRPQSYLCSLSWLWINSKAISRASPGLGSPPKLSLQAHGGTARRERLVPAGNRYHRDKSA